MKKRFLSMLMVIIIVMTMIPTATVAAETTETLGGFSVTVVGDDVNSVASYNSDTKILTVTGDCSIANTTPNTPTNDTISIEGNCTVTLAGVNIQALAPDNRNDFINSNPININGNYQVTINLASDKINTLGFTPTCSADSGNVNIKLGSGKAGLHVASGAALTIDGTGTLNTTGAEGFNAWTSYAHGGGGAGIGGDGRRTYETSDAETSGTIIIKNGTINAQGGNTTGYWGGGGAGIGGGGGVFQYGGGSCGEVTISGGNVTAIGGSPGNTRESTGGSGIGPGGRGGDEGWYGGTDGTANQVIISGGIVKALGGVKLNDATSPDKGGKYGVEGTHIFISGDSTRLEAQGALQALSCEPVTSDSGKVVSASDGYSWQTKDMLVSFQTAPDPDIAAVEAAKTALLNGEVNVAFGADQTAKTAEVQSYVDSLLSATTTGVSAVVTYNNSTGMYDVALSKGSVSDSKSLTMTVNVGADPDIAILEAAKTAAENASYSNMTQATATNEAAIQAALQSTAETAVNDNSVTVTIDKVSYTAPVEGTSADPDGRDGSYTFTITVSKGLQHTTTIQKTITITASAYMGITDVQAVEAAKTALLNGEVNVAFGADQTTKTAEVQSYVDSLLSATTTGVSAVVTYNNSTGMYDVALSKGSVSDSKSLTMTVNVGADPDIAILEAAKTAAENASYSNMTQATATNEAAIQAALQSTAETAVNDNSVTVTIDKVSYTAPVEGTSADPDGRDGSYTFTITVSKGLQHTTTIQKTITITASAYMGGGSSIGNTPNPPVNTVGTITKEQKQDGNAPSVSLNDNSDNLKSKVLSAVEQSLVASGQDAKVILKVEDISSSVSEEDKKQIKNKLAEEAQDTNNVRLLYIDISLFKQIGNGQETRVTQTNGKISISLEIPENMWNTMQGVDRSYFVIRIHNGVAERLEGTYDPSTHVFTFETDKFSTYALAYEDVDTTAGNSNGNTSDNLTVYNDFNHLRLKVIATETSQKLTFVKVSGADGYFIYGAICGKPQKKLADVKETVTNYTFKNLKSNTFYKYQVKAYKIINGEKVIIATSKVVHSVTTSKTYGNPIKVTIDKSSINMEVGKTQKVITNVILPKNKKIKNHTTQPSFESTNKNIAIVSSNGTITAKAKGSCYIYVYAQNGVYAKIKVTVK